MDTHTILVLVAGAAAAGFVNGLAGFGTALFSLGFWLQIFPPVQAVALSVVVSSLTGMQGLWIVRRHILDQPRRLLRFLIPGLAGLPLGLAALSFVEPHLLKLLIAGFLILYGVFFLSRRALPRFERRTHATDACVGFLGGVLGGLAGLSGALPAMWCGLRPWPRQETRAVLQPFNVAILSLSAVSLALRGVYDWATLQALAIALVVSVGAAQLGIATFKRMSDTQFRWLLIVLMFLSGTALMVREIA